MTHDVTITMRTPGHDPELIAMFETAFTVSSGTDEGALVANLTRNLLKADGRDLIVLIAMQDQRPIGGAIFSRLRFGDDPRAAFLLGPLAVAPIAQRHGLGGTLVEHGLDELRSGNAVAAFVYGDPRYYGRFGFGATDSPLGPPPFPLEHPEGWLAQWLGDTPPPRPFQDASRCVDALHQARYW